MSAIDNRRMAANGNGATHETADAQPGRTSCLLNGPRLDGETGSVSQHDIDAMFP